MNTSLRVSRVGLAGGALLAAVGADGLRSGEPRGRAAGPRRARRAAVVAGPHRRGASSAPASAASGAGLDRGGRADHAGQPVDRDRAVRRPGPDRVRGARR